MESSRPGTHSSLTQQPHSDRRCWFERDPLGECRSDVLRPAADRAQSSESAVCWHHCDISDTDVLWLLPAEEDNVCEFRRLNEGRVAKHLAVFLKTDPHLLMNRCSNQSGRKINNTNVVLSF